jgi:hypothetical protein
VLPKRIKSTVFAGDGVAKMLAADRDMVTRIMSDKTMTPEDKRSAVDLTYLIMIEHAKNGLKLFKQNTYQPRAQ